MSPVELGLQALLAVALGASLPVAIRLTRALTSLRRDRAELDASVKAFTLAVDEAEQAIQRLRTSSNSAARRLIDQVDAAEQLGAELRNLLSRADTTLERLAQVERRRDALPGQVAPAMPGPVAPDADAGAPAQPVAPPQPPPEGQRPVAAMTAAARPAKAPPSGPREPDAGRLRAEQAVLKILRGNPKLP